MGLRCIMISSSFNIVEFVNAAQGKGYHDIIHMADQEATEAGRLLIHPRTSEEARGKGADQYVTILEELIFFLRYGIRPHGLSDAVFQLFRALCEGLLEKSRGYSRCYDLI